MESRENSQVRIEELTDAAENHHNPNRQVHNPATERQTTVSSPPLQMVVSMRGGRRRRKAGHGKERWTYKASEKSMATVLLCERHCFRRAGWEMYFQLRYFPFFVYFLRDVVLCFRVLQLCRVKISDGRLQSRRGDEEAWKVATVSGR